MGVMEPGAAVPYVPPAPRAESLAEARTLVEQIRSAHRQFIDAVPATRSRIAAAAGAAPGSDAWSDAQVALAALESRRNPALIALADLDRIYVDISSAGEDTVEVEALREDIAALVSQQDAIITELSTPLLR